MNGEFAAIVATPVAVLGIRLWREALCGVDFLPADTPLLSPDGEVAGSIVTQLEDYFLRVRGFDLPLALAGTPFQRRVWQALRSIPPGETRRYGQLAARLGSSPRAVGNACRANPVPIVVPCHRVVAAAGPGGYAGAVDGPLFDIKRRLLAHEGVHLE